MDAVENFAELVLGKFINLKIVEHVIIDGVLDDVPMSI